MNLPVSGPESAILEILPAYERIEKLKLSLVMKYSEYKPISNRTNIYLIYKFKNSKLNTIYFFIKSFFKIIEIHKKEHIDVINIHSYHYNLISPLCICLLFKIPLLIKAPMDFTTAYREEFRSIFSRIFFFGWMNFFKKFIKIVKNVYIQAVNDKIYEDLLALNFPKKRLIKLANGISSKKYLNLKKHNKTETHFGYVGRLLKSKNLRYLLKTFAKYLSQFPKDKLYIYGNGPEEKNIIRFINNNKLTNNIIFCGFKRDKLKIYSNINALIHPSFGEGNPNTILEAMCTDTFVIASKVSGNQDVIDHNIDGLLFNPYKETDLLNQLSFYKAHNDLVPQFLQNAKKKVINDYDIDIEAKIIYKFLINKSI